MIFGEKLLNIKCVSILSAAMSVIFLIVREFEILAYVYVHVVVKYLI
jgi:hypothetical protein